MLQDAVPRCAEEELTKDTAAADAEIICGNEWVEHAATLFHAPGQQ